MFWEDTWNEGGKFKCRFPRMYALESCKSITVGRKLAQSSLIDSFRRSPRAGAKQQQYNDLEDMVTAMILALILNRLVWSLESSGEFTVASVRKLIDDKWLSGADNKTRWIKYVPIKINVHAWKVMSDSIPTRFNISRRGINIDSLSCVLCDNGVETSNHLFFSCCFVRQVFRLIMRFGMENCDTVLTPMVEQAKLKLDLVRKPVDHTDYQSVIGSLMYVTSSRPDIMFATCMCARYQANPNKHHMSAVKRIFRYPKGTINLCLWYPKDSNFDLTAYSDADHAGCHLDRKTESEYVTLSSCCAQLLWMRTQLTDYGFFYDKEPIYCDSKSAIAISCNPNLTWIGLPEFVDDTITDYTRPSPSVESNPNDLQNSSSSASENEDSTSSILSKPEIKFVKPADSPTVVKTEKKETVRKPSIKYAELYRKTTKRSNVRGVKKGKSSLRNNYTHKSMPPRPVIHKSYRPPMRPIRPNVNNARPKTTQDLMIILIQRVKRLERELKSRTSPIKVHKVDRGRSRTGIDLPRSLPSHLGKLGLGVTPPKWAAAVYDVPGVSLHNIKTEDTRERPLNVSFEK
nr:copia protein [Tanacetum cinerariifolium]